MELEWLKKSSHHSVEVERAMIESQNPKLSVRRQCELLGLNRTTLYYEPAQESALNLDLMRLIDAQYLKNAVLWLPADDGLPAPARVYGQSQACPAANAHRDGHRRHAAWPCFPSHARR